MLSALLIRGACFKAKTEEFFVLVAASVAYLCLACSSGQIVEASRFATLQTCSTLFKIGGVILGLEPTHFAVCLTMMWISDSAVVLLSFESMPEPIAGAIFSHGLATCLALCMSILQSKTMWLLHRALEESSANGRAYQRLLGMTCDCELSLSIGVSSSDVIIASARGACLAMLGCDAEGRLLTEFVKPDDHGRLKNALQTAGQGLPFLFPMTLVTAGGFQKEVELLMTRTSGSGALLTGMALGDGGDFVELDLAGAIKFGLREHWLIDPAQLQLQPGFLGQGGFAVVLEASYYGSPVAVKVARVDVRSMTEELAEKRCILPPFLHEIRMLRFARHPNIINFYGACINPVDMEVALVFHKITGPTLKDFISQLHVVQALHYLHSRQPTMVHGDLKDSNVFVECGLHGVKGVLGDFGLARRITKTSGRMGGTFRWAAPEIIHGSGAPSTAADIFSLGNLAHFMVSGNAPMAGMLRKEMMRVTKTGPLPTQIWPPTALAEVVQPVAEKCLNFQPNARPPIAWVHDELLILGRLSPTGLGREAYDSLGKTCATPGKPLLCFRDAVALARNNLPAES
ncbi:unnamed protein product [Polarella glacialis]|uniref:Protein kinase domain-containing protein n=1 Tax=Polarella glacialis TaxID=89957 RepID=A0A813EMQ8_POLGL|nr:unnamed protein product [Polarella glacialis]